jgi:alanyl-tRNA synthetase
VDTVRIVQIGDFDATACGGLHVTATGQVGLCKISGSEKIRGRTRIHTKIGNRAYRDYREKTRLLRDLGLFLTCGEDVILKRVEDLNASYSEAKKEINRYLSEWIPLLFKERLEKASLIDNITYIEQVFDQVDQKALKIFLELGLSESGRIVMLINRQADQLNWMIGHSIQEGFDLMELIREDLPLIDARGGGKGQLLQGGGRNVDGIEDFLLKIRQKLERKMKNHE